MNASTTIAPSVASDAAIHRIHPYPCRFPAWVPRRVLVGEGPVLDPFCGSGTTLLESATQGIESIGFDCNPVAVLITRFKLLETDPDFFDRAEIALADLAARRDAVISCTQSMHGFHGRDHWFAPHVQGELSALLDWIATVNDSRLTTWLRTALSAIVNRVSYQDSETRYARVEKVIPRGETYRLFQSRADAALQALRDRPPVASSKVRVKELDVAKGIPLPSESVAHVITSPPYANTMDYYLYHKQRMNVLGFSFKTAQRSELGSRWEYSSLRASKEKWRQDLSRILKDIGRVLRPGGLAHLVIGDSQIAGELVDAEALVSALGYEAGLETKTLESVPLASRTGSFNRAFQRPNKIEHLIELRK